MDLETLLARGRADDFNTQENRIMLDLAVRKILKKMGRIGPVPVDYTIDIDYTNNSLLVYFSQEQTPWVK